MVKEVEEGEARVVKPGVVGFDGRLELAYNVGMQKSPCC